MPGKGSLWLLANPVPQWGFARVSDLLDREFGLAGELSALAGERDQNLRLDSPDSRLTLKIASASESVGVLGMQLEAMEHVARQTNHLVVPSPLRSLDGRLVVRSGDELVRVVSFLEGTLLRDLPDGAVPPYQIGLSVATVQKSLQGFFHPEAGRRIAWDARSAGASTCWG